MGRPPLPVGTFGQIHFLRLNEHRVGARSWFRDVDGRRRLVTRTGQSGPSPSGGCGRPA